MPKEATPAPAGPIRISTNAIVNGQFFNAYEPLPFERVEDLPENFRPLVVTALPEDEDEPNEPRGAFELNAIYQLTSDGRLGRRLQREVAQMEAQEAQEEWSEEQMDAPLPPQVAESLQEEHERLLPDRCRRFMSVGAQGTMRPPTRRGSNRASRFMCGNPTAFLNASAKPMPGPSCATSQ